jgi:DNA (cytosine-5)-methyltransferase 1
MHGLIVDSFAGLGGASLGIERALGRSPDIAINHNPVALALHAANHPDTLHLTHDVWKVDPIKATGGKPVAVLWASPDCKHHSKAKGGKPREKGLRDLAWVVVRWAKSVRPTLIFLENVEEFRDWGPLSADGSPDPRRKGQTFADWVSKLERCGYRVEYRELRACDYGAPTIRKRLYLVARRDGKPIVWPKPTHGDPKGADVVAGRVKPWRTAAEILDWSLPCPSIFLTRDEARAQGCNRPLAPATMARIARGVKRYVLDAAEPFIVRTDMASAAARNGVHGLDEPIRTATTANTFAAVSPFVAYAQHGGRERSAEDPLHTVAASRKDQNQVVAPFLAALTHHGGDRSHPVEDPLKTITAAHRGETAMISPFLVPRYGERPGQEPRSRPVDVPSPTIVPDGNGGSLAACFLAQNNTGEPGHDARKPLSTIVGKGCTQSVVACHILNMKGSARQSHEVERPLPTMTAQVGHVSMIGAFLTKYYGAEQDPRLEEPLHTVTVRDRFGLVDWTAAAPPFDASMAERARQVAAFLRAEGVWDGPGEFVTIGAFLLVDIGLRMLTPRELARGQGFPDSFRLEDVILDGKPIPKSAQTSGVGNSVCPDMAEAIVRANAVDAPLMADAEAYRPWGEALKARLLDKARGVGQQASLFDTIAAGPA